MLQKLGELRDGLREIKHGDRVLSLYGRDLTIKEITGEDIIVQGKVNKLEFHS
jgi:hypothetical protein